jgi:deaminated glutathione amidase
MHRIVVITSILFSTKGSQGSRLITRRNMLQSTAASNIQTTTSTSTMLAAVQMTSTNDKSLNLQATIRLVECAAANGAFLVSLPECSSFIGGGIDDIPKNSAPIDAVAASEKLDGTYALALCELASRLKIWLSVGGFPETIDDERLADTPLRSTKGYNTHFMISPAGVVTDIYRKIHLFDCPLVGLFESAKVEPGASLTVADCGFARIGLTTCYDLRFPELYGALCRPLASDSPTSNGNFDNRGLGAEIVLIPSAFTVTTGIAHWETLLRARAIENQCYVVAAAQIGSSMPCYVVEHIGSNPSDCSPFSLSAL